jgi:hexosaminidase
MYWSNSETFRLKFKESDILLFWDSAGGINQLLKQYPNNRKVLALSDRYYLDCGRGNKYGDRSWCDPFKTWWNIYSFDPKKYTFNDDTVLGGEVLAWSEILSDSNIQPVLWPRSASLSDRLWGDE